jgi:microcystin-dependent protein
MADLIVTPALQLKETDILTVDKLNLMATPVVELSIETPVTDENFFRNGNFYSSFWATPAGLSCPVGVETSNANYWTINPNGAAVSCKRSTDTPDLYSLWSMELDGAAGATDCSVGQQINGDLSATLRRPCTWSGYIENNSGSLLSPTLEIWTCDAFNDFTHVTLQTTVNLQTVPNGNWSYETVTIDLSGSGIANVANGLFIKIRLPNGALSQAIYRINFARLKIQLGELATQFADDPSLFIQSPSVDSTMLQDGCIARSSLFLPNVIPKGAYQAGSIQSGDIGAGQVKAANLDPAAVSGSLGYTPVNKAGDTGVGIIEHDVDTAVGAGAAALSGVFINGTASNANNNATFPSIGFGRPSVVSRAIGLDINARFKTVDGNGLVGFLLDTVTGVDTNSYQAGSITWQALAQSLINILVPSGMVRMYAGPSPPGGWLVCDGRAVSRTTYAALFAAIGTYWGVGDNFSTFNLPDFRGRSPLGYVSSAVGGITSRGFGSLGGEENHTLSVAELASHNHGVVNDYHGHGISQNPHSHTVVNSLGVFAGGAGSAAYVPSGGVQTSADNANISVVAGPSNVSIAANGGNGAHNNLQPFAVLYFIVKT